MSQRQIILDTETTGLDPARGHRLTEIGCLEMKDRRLTGRKFHAYINPEREIDEAAAKITGLTLAFLRDKPKFSEIVSEFIGFLQEEKTELIIHNAPFDLGFLNWELELLNHPWRPIENNVGIIDTLVIARRMHPGQRNNLDALCRRYNVDNSNREYHGALLDAELLSKVYLAMTAGQVSLSFSTESQTNIQSSQTNLQVKKVVRGGSLKVIRASEEEYRRHEERIHALAKE